MLDWILNLDTQLFLLLNALHTPFFDPIMIFVSGKLTWLPLYLLIVLYMYKHFGWRFVWPLLGIALVVVLADQSSVHLFKNIFQRMRPCHNPIIKDLIYLPTGRCAGGRFGFVSSHAANVFGVAVCLVFLIKKRWFTIFILAWAALVSYSRIYLGAHYPGDVFFGAILGAIIGYSVWNLIYGINRVKQIL